MKNTNTTTQKPMIAMYSESATKEQREASMMWCHESTSEQLDGTNNNQAGEV